MGIRIRRSLATASVFAAAISGLAVATPAQAATAAGAHTTAVVQPHNLWRCTAFGTGPTLAAARDAAREMWVGNRVVGPITVTYGQYADGTWWYQMAGDCYLVQ